MTPKQVESVREGLRRNVRMGAGLDDAQATADALLALLRRDWAVRVLDRHGRALVAKHGAYHSGVDPAVLQLSTGSFTVSWWGSAAYRVGEHRSEDAARMAAADAIFPELPAEVRTELGKRPEPAHGG